MTSTLNMEDLFSSEDWQLEQSLGLTLFDDPWKSVDLESTDLKSTLPNSGSDDLDSLLVSHTDHLAVDPLCESWMENVGIAEMLQSLVQDSEDAMEHIDSEPASKTSCEAADVTVEVKGHEILRSLIEQSLDMVPTPAPVAEEAIAPTIKLGGDLSFTSELEAPMSPIHLTDMDDIMHSPLSAEDVESLLSGSEPSSPQSSSAATETSSTCSELQAMLLESSPPPKSNGKSRTRSSPYSRASGSRNAKSKGKDTSEIDDLQVEFLSKKDKKKLQNKNAAIRYRQKKKQEADCVKGEENVLETKNKELKDQVDQLAREIKYMKDLMAEVYKAKGVIKT